MIQTNGTNGNGNGNGSKVLWWIIGGLSTVLVSVFGFNMPTVLRDASRISVLEAHFEDQLYRLKSIETKLDQLLLPHKGE